MLHLLNFLRSATRGNQTKKLVSEASQDIACLPQNDHERLILEHLPQIKYLAQRIITIIPAQVELRGLVRVGIAGLLAAAAKFDPSRGVKFQTYAQMCIKEAILDSLGSLNCASRSLRSKRRMLENTYFELERHLGQPATTREVCRKLSIDFRRFRRLIDEVKGLSLGEFHSLPCQSAAKQLLGYSPDPAPSPFFIFSKAEVKKILTEAIDALPKNERLIFSLYYHDQLTTKEIAEVLKVNESRVSQLHTKATLRLRAKLRRSPWKLF